MMYTARWRETKEENGEFPVHLNQTFSNGNNLGYIKLKSIIFHLWLKQNLKSSYCKNKFVFLDMYK